MKGRPAKMPHLAIPKGFSGVSIELHPRPVRRLYCYFTCEIVKLQKLRNLSKVTSELNENDNENGKTRIGN